MAEPPVGEQPDQTLDASNLPAADAPAATLAPVTLSHLEDLTSASDRTLQPPAEAVLTTAPSEQSRLGRYVIHAEIGRGGMGAVLRGRDPVLGRHLAIKVLLAGRKDDHDARRRFHEEAQIGGQLQHPGLVPVYELGTDDDGRPFFAMKLVDGLTLAALLKERSSPAGGLPRFLTVFEQVCQALAYAHARGVIHRDLKPANVMVGAFGEVQVMDWGLAKVLGGQTDRTPAGTATAKAEATIQTARTESGGSDSCAGSAMGTPAYMPPEQARGEIDHLDRRADVFGLGAILCEILTGQPPFAGRTVAEILKQAASGDVSDTSTRLDRCGADADLIALAKACLAPAREDRPVDAGAVANRVAGYQASVAERLRRSELERAAAEAREAEAQAKAAAERYARRLTLGLVTTAALLLILGGAGAWWLRQQRLERQLEETRRAAEQARTAAERDRHVEEDLVQTEQALRRSAWNEAGAALERAEVRLAGAEPGPLEERLRQLRADRDLARRLEEAWLVYSAITLVDKARASLIRAEADRLFQAAFDLRGWRTRGGNPEELAAVIRNSPVQGPIIAALGRWSHIRRGLAPSVPTDFLDTVVDRVDLDPWRTRLRSADRTGDRAALERFVDNAEEMRHQSPASLLFLGEMLLEGNRALDLKPIAPLVFAHRQQPGDFSTNMACGHAWMRGIPLNTSHAAPYYQAAVALRPDSAAAHYHLAVSYIDSQTLDNLSRAESAFREAIHLQSDLVWAHDGLADLLRKQHRLAEAEAEYRTAIRLAPGLFVFRFDLGSLLRQQGRLDEAETTFRDAVRLTPENGAALSELALTLRQRGGLKEALAVLNDSKGDPEMQRRLWSRWTDEARRLARVRKQHADAVRLYTDTFTTWPDAAEDRRTTHRYDAACYAVLASAAPNVAERERTLLRRQALEWLRADLGAWDRVAVMGKPEDRKLVQRKMELWKKDADLVSVRGDAIARLSEGERADWQQLWLDAEALAKKAGTGL